MKRACIVPFTKNEYPLLLGLRDKYEITLITPKGFSLSGQDACILRNTSPTGFVFASSLDSEIRKAEMVIISNVSKKNASLYAYTLNAFHIAISLGKEIWCFLDLSEDEKREELNECERCGAICKFSSFFSEIPAKLYENTQLYQFDVPVFSIEEMVPGCNGYDLFLKLAKSFQDEEKTVLAISDDCYNSLFDYITIDFSEKMSLSDAVFRMNRLFYSLYCKYNPDVIIIRHSQPMMKYSDKIPFDSGLTAYAISQSISCDGCIFCSLYGVGGYDYWQSVNNIMVSRLGYPILGVHISNQLVDSMTNTIGNLVSLSTDEHKEALHEYNKNGPIQCYDLLDKKEFSHFFSTIYNDFFDLPYGVI